MRKKLFVSAATFALVAGAVPVPSAIAAEALPNLQDARLDWNLKRSFSNYLTGPIAQGKVEVTEPGDLNNFGGFLEYNPPTQRFQSSEVPLKYGFKFNPANSKLDANGKGVLAFDGAVRWTGHKAHAPEGQDYGLDIQFSDVKVHVDGTAGEISVDYWLRGTNITGDESALNERGDDAVFATFTLPEAITPAAGKTFNTSPDGVTKDSGVKTTLTEEGAKKIMIGFYEPIQYDDALFDLSVTFAGAAAGVPTLPAPQPTPTSTPSPAPSESMASSSQELSSTDKGSPAERITTSVTLVIAGLGLLGVLSGFGKFAFDRFLRPMLAK